LKGKLTPTNSSVTLTIITETNEGTTERTSAVGMRRLVVCLASTGEGRRLTFMGITMTF
jgi:hypothetical protein